MATVNELVTALGFELKPDAKAVLDRYDSMISELGGRVKEKWKESVEAGKVAQDRIMMQNLTGISAAKQEQWRQVAASYGIEAESFLGSIGRLYKLGAKESDILRWADEIKGSSFRKRMDLQNELGLSDDAMYVMSQGSKAIKDIMDSVGSVDPKQLESTAKGFQKVNSIQQSISEAHTKLMGKPMQLLGESSWMDDISKHLMTQEGQQELQAAEITGGLFSGALAVSKGHAVKTAVKSAASKALSTAAKYFGKQALETGAKTAVVNGVQTATGATAAGETATTAATGSAVGSAALSLLATKAIYDSVNRGVKIWEEGVDKGLELKPMEERTFSDWIDISQWAIMTGKEIGEAFGDVAYDMFGKKVTNSYNNIVVQVENTQQANDIVNEYTKTEPTVPGAYQETMNP